ncbi:MAG: alpha/beta hydrolase [Magnetovibrionaceae bacterium]
MQDSPVTNEAAKRLIRDQDGAEIAYHKTEAAKPGLPGIVFLTGFKSDMTGGKALHLEQVANGLGLGFLRFDYTGHGESSGDFEQGTIGQWAADAIYALDHLTQGPQVLVGSSMGGWIMLLVALARPERIKGLVGIAAAPDFTEDLMWNAFDDAQKKELTETGRMVIPNCYEDLDDYAISMKLIEEGRNNLLLAEPIPFDGPVRLIHGIQDEDVPWETALTLQKQLTSDDIEVTLVKNGGHRLSEPEDLERLTHALEAVLAKLS